MDEVEWQKYWKSLTPEQRADLERQWEEGSKESLEMVERDIKRFRAWALQIRQERAERTVK